MPLTIFLLTTCGLVIFGIYCIMEPCIEKNIYRNPASIRPQSASINPASIKPAPKPPKTPPGSNHPRKRGLTHSIISVF